MRRGGGPDRASTWQIALERIWPLIERTCGCDVDVLRARISALIGRTLAAMARAEDPSAGGGSPAASPEAALEEGVRAPGRGPHMKTPGNRAAGV